MTFRIRGLPLAALVAAALVSAAAAKEETGPGDPPRVVSQAKPRYPDQMRWLGMRGQVIVDFVVDKNGAVQNPVVYESTNPGFEEAAIDAVSHWKFRPGRKDGKPVNTHMRVPIIFQLDRGPSIDPFHFADWTDHGNDLFTVKPGAQSKLPAQYRYDTPPRIEGVILPVYPHDLLAKHVTGEARVVGLIDTQGRVIRTAILQATRPEFGYALQAALATFRFDPALRRGKPTMTLFGQSQSFNLEMLTDHLAPWAPWNDRSLIREIEKHPDRLVDGRTLDHPLHPISLRSPVFPPDLSGVTHEGSAQLKIVVDDTGHARIPEIVSCTRPEFGYAAVQAVTNWLFDPPEVHGKPVMTQVEVPFLFSDQPKRHAAQTAAR